MSAPPESPAPKREPGEWSPKIIGILCNWCSYAGADLAGGGRIQYPPDVRVVRVMCTGRINALFVLKAFADGADGVLVSGCHFGDCHYLEVDVLADNVTEGSTVITDDWQGYPSATKGYHHQRHVVTGQDSNALMPGVHRVSLLLKRWLLDTHQGGIASTHLQDYLDEFTFRFNWRTSRARGLLCFRLLDQAIDHDPVRYRDLVVNPDIGNPRAHHPTGPRQMPGTLALPPADRPWRAPSR